MIDGDERRKLILSSLENAEKATSATKLSKEYGVSRQVIVGDIALLRASGTSITATSRGYLLDDKQEGIIKTIVANHEPERTIEEVELIVSLGAELIDVSVEHPLYGELTGGLHLKTTQDVDDFMKLRIQSGAGLLSELTHGIHMHKILVRDEAHFIEVENTLKEKDLLYIPK
jgi:transcriptional regulator of NAD metabolism